MLTLVGYPYRLQKTRIYRKFSLLLIFYHMELKSATENDGGNAVPNGLLMSIPAFAKPHEYT